MSIRDGKPRFVMLGMLLLEADLINVPWSLCSSDAELAAMNLKKGSAARRIRAVDGGYICLVMPCIIIIIDKA